MLRLFRIKSFQAPPEKYIWFAIIEVLLVVIGIFIALQVNSWTEEQKLRTIEKSVLIDLRSELYTNISHLDSIIGTMNYLTFPPSDPFILHNRTY